MAMADTNSTPTEPDVTERTVSVPGGYLTFGRSLHGGLSVMEYEHDERDGGTDLVAVAYVPPTVEALSALITEAHLLLTDVRRLEAQREAAGRDEVLAEWLAGSDERTAAFLARCDADGSVESGTSPTFLASLGRVAG